MSHSLKNFRDPLFLYRKIMFGLFFFSAHFWHDFCFFFFSSEKFTFTPSLDFFRKIPKNKLFPGKKNATFEVSDQASKQGKPSQAKPS